MTAQEEERRRIGRELHDGVNQEVAALSIAFSLLGTRLPEGTAADRGARSLGSRTRTVELSEAVRHLSHELHPGMLEHMGLVAALRGHCGEFNREHRLAVTFRSDDELEIVPPDVVLCLYRVTQEALMNVARHAGASHVVVTVLHDGAEWRSPSGTTGAGSTSRTRESRRPRSDQPRRAGPSRRGRLAIDTQTQLGTAIRVVVPRSHRDAE